jgi:hypothetical protein
MHTKCMATRRKPRTQCNQKRALHLRQTTRSHVPNHSIDFHRPLLFFSNLLISLKNFRHSFFFLKNLIYSVPLFASSLFIYDCIYAKLNVFAFIHIFFLRFDLIEGSVCQKEHKINTFDNYRF